MSQTIMSLGYPQSTIADPDVYRRAATKGNGKEYYEFLLEYVDGILCISEKPRATMDKLAAIYDLIDSVKEPERYLGANIRQWQCPDGRIVWAMDGKDYITNAVAIVKDMLAEDGLRLAMGKGTDRPMPRSYRPELDTTPKLDDIKSNQYQQLIGILCWAVEIGRVDILLEVVRCTLIYLSCQSKRGSFASCISYLCISCQTH
jgi:hypothetical protein